MSGFLSRRFGSFQQRLLGNLSSEHRKGLFGIGWSTIAYFATILIRLGSSLVLTRLLAPEAYGIFAPAMAILTVVELLSDIGLRPALIRHAKGMEPLYLGTGWWFGLTRSMLLTTVVFGIGCSYTFTESQSTLGWVLMVLCLRPLIHAFSSPMLPMLYREMNYKDICRIELMQTMIGVVAGICFALFVPTVWALVVATLVGELTYVFMSYALCPRAIRPKWDRHAAKELYSFGNQVFFNTLVMGLWLYLDRMLGLYLIDEKEMGLFAIAWNLAEAVDRLMNRFCEVYYSMLSRREDPAAQMRYHQLISQKMALFGMPILAIGVLIAPFTIWLMYDKRYVGAGILFALMMARLMMRALGQMQYQYLLVRGEIYLQTRCYIIALIVQVAAFFPLTIQLGVNGMALSAVISTTVLTLCQNILFIRRGNLSPKIFLISLGWLLAAITTAWWLVSLVEPGIVAAK